MNWENIENGWKTYKANAKQQWGKLSDEQLEGTLGKRDQLSRKVQEAYGISKEDTEKQVAEWQSRQRDQQQATQPAK
jgi:uncharacterized protein YjbJ (UPF0337 family)